MGVKARIKTVFDVSFGLGFALLAVATGIRFDVTEVIMNNTNAFAACVWCGVSLLRGASGGKAPTQTRGTSTVEVSCFPRESERFDSLPPHFLFDEAVRCAGTDTLSSGTGYLV